MAAMEHLAQQARQLILRPELHDVLAILKGARNGLVYGVSECSTVYRCWQLPASEKRPMDDRQMRWLTRSAGLLPSRGPLPPCAHHVLDLLAGAVSLKAFRCSRLRFGVAGTPEKDIHAEDICTLLLPLLTTD